MIANEDLYFDAWLRITGKFSEEDNAPCNFCINADKGDSSDRSEEDNSLANTSNLFSTT
jgi:hypothetical protein